MLRRRTGLCVRQQPNPPHDQRAAPALEHNDPGHITPILWRATEWNLD